MGLILDSTVLIAAERKKRQAQVVLEEVNARCPGEVVAISVMTVMKLRHGAMRADTAARRAIRERFFSEVMSVLPALPVTTTIAVTAAEIDAENYVRGVRLALPDLLIGATALVSQYSVLTSNIRHFQMISGLDVIPMI